ncbi:MAG: hypothetical protein KatS3mg029_0120 [Saprospiraceae bacterium]|nr:MAG: hypothetical protein KatS3mg029_0120 [Saprospiraceae bacterium]
MSIERTVKSRSGLANKVFADGWMTKLAFPYASTRVAP